MPLSVLGSDLYSNHQKTSTPTSLRAYSTSMTPDLLMDKKNDIKELES